MTREIVIFVLHKPRLGSAKSANADATPSPAAVRRVRRKLGAAIRDVRRRRLPMAVAAERTFTSRSTLQRSKPAMSMAASASKGAGFVDSLQRTSRHERVRIINKHREIAGQKSLSFGRRCRLALLAAGGPHPRREGHCQCALICYQDHRRRFSSLRISASRSRTSRSGAPFRVP